MAVLTEQDRYDTWADWMRTNADAVIIRKQAVRDAVNALDDWLNANAGTINAALPQPARADLTISQKAALLTHVVAKRYIKGA